MEKTVKMNFERMPHFKQSGLFYADQFSAIRKCTLTEKVKLFNSLMYSGKLLESEKEYLKALYKYEEALAIFRWLEYGCTENGMRISELYVKSELLMYKAAALTIQCLLAIAKCCLKLGLWRDSVIACDEVLRIDRQNALAYYRKAKGVIGGENGVHEAFLLVKRAVEIDGTTRKFRETLEELKGILKDNGAFMDDNRSFKVFSNEFGEILARSSDLLDNLRGENRSEYVSELKNTLNYLEKHRKDIEELLNPSKTRKNAHLSTISLDIEQIKLQKKRIRSFPRNPIQSYKRQDNYLYWTLLVIGILAIIIIQ